jgi:hypothetical protein
MRQAFMSIEMAFWDLFTGCGACRGRRSTWGSWRM